MVGAAPSARWLRWARSPGGFQAAMLPSHLYAVVIVCLAGVGVPAGHPLLPGGALFGHLSEFQLLAGHAIAAWIANLLTYVAILALWKRRFGDEKN